MKKHLLLYFIPLFMLSCNDSNTATTTQHLGSETITPVNIEKAKTAKVWLTKAIEEFFLSTNADPKTITTVRYNEYKSDATQVEMDGGLSPSEFLDKWGKIYDTKYAGMGVGFLISGQDYGKIKVSKCELKETPSEHEYLFDVQIDDPQMNTFYHLDIIVLESNNSFLIDDVKEYD